MVRNARHWQAGDDVGRRHVQHRGLLELPQPVHLLFEITRLDAGKTDLQHALQARPVERVIQGTRVQQFVQQDRVLNQLGRHPGAGGAQPGQLRQRHRVFHQQGQVSGAPGDRLQQLTHALQDPHRMAFTRCRIQQQRHQLVQPLAPLLTQMAGDRPVPEYLQPSQDDRAVWITGLHQHSSSRLPVSGTLPDILHARRLLALLIGHSSARFCKHLCKLLTHHSPMPLQLRKKGLPVRKSHGVCKPGHARFVTGQVVNLLVLKGLQAILGAAQKQIGICQLRAGRGRQVTQHGQCIQHIQHATLLQHRLPPATHQLKGLRDELDFAYTTRPQFDVVLHALALDLAHDLFLEAAQ